MAAVPLAAREVADMAFRKERVDLACAFRWAARLDMHEAVANHFSLAIDGTRFLLNPRGRHFSRTDGAFSADVRLRMNGQKLP